MKPSLTHTTLPWLCAFFFSAVALNNDSLTIGAGNFKLSLFDVFFVVIVAIKFMRLGQPGAYTLPSSPVIIALALQGLALAYLAATSYPNPGIAGPDVARDLRIVFYFISIPFLCYKDIDSAGAYATLQKTIVFSGTTVAFLLLAEQATGFSVTEPLRNVRLAVWLLPFSIISIIFFPRTLRLGRASAYLLTLFMFVALAMSLNRSQYLQLAVSVVLAAILGGQARALQKTLVLFVPAIIAGVSVFYLIGYMDVLISRIFTVQELEYDSSYGARVQEMQGQMDLFRQAPIFGHGAGLRSWVMGEEGFELSTFAHNSWAFYLMKFGIVGTVLIMATPLAIMLLSLVRPYAHPGLELHRRYLVCCLPIYVVVDSMSGGLAYAPKTAFLGFMLCYALSLVHNGAAFQPMVRKVRTGMNTGRTVHHG
ncbi:MAG: O-antigen ligase family protein [Pigmentiphaga sp.]|uniref:O-antigen ligase family protein n=1 Tax=Pigmentiphaga sp. TaxID=1977564 RepID=UPI0029B2B445|nr:O-antigen ligase family protein [Pigmentiphaga sp.]MDX3905548.1 O-antigen ligase family protein [Pigmentiphaga sp.]